MKIISGGQTGIDQLALFVAFSRRLSYSNISTGGTAPKGWWTTDGACPRLARFGLKENSEFGYPSRTRKNVMNADLTILVYENGTSAGERLTRTICAIQSKPLVEFDLLHPQDFAEKLGQLTNLAQARDAHIFNFAGNSEQTCPGIYARAFSSVEKIVDALIEIDRRRGLEK